jgi:hypothetical protein
MFVKISLITLGVLVAALGCYGALEWSLSLEGKLSYLVVATSVIPVIGAFIPYFADLAKQQKRTGYAIAWWFSLIPVVAVMFFSSAERVHVATAGAAAERAASRGAVTLAEKALDAAQRKLDAAEADAKKARLLPRAPASRTSKPASWCDAACLARWDAEADAARARVAAARGEISALAAKAPQEAAIKLPAWLIPAATEPFAFLALAMGLLWQMPERKAKRKRNAKRKSTPKPPKQTPAAVKAPVVPLRVVGR